MKKREKHNLLEGRKKKSNENSGILAIAAGETDVE